MTEKQKNILEKIVSKIPSKWFEESNKRFQERELNTTPARTLEEAEEWCKRQLERKCNK
jgi:hypothetical protein